MKKLLAIFILMCLVASVFSGCVDNSPTTDSGNGDESITEDLNDKNEEKKDPEDSNTDDNRDDNSTDNKDESGSDNNEDNNQTENNENGDENVTPTVGTKIGDIMAAVTLQKIDGSGTVSINDYKGKIIIFNCWATWCGPCTYELPHFEQFAGDYKDDVVIIAAHTAYQNYNAESYVSTYYPNSNIVFAYDTAYDSAYYAAGGNGYIPYTTILDRNGVIVYSGSGALSYSDLAAIVEGLK